MNSNEDVMYLVLDSMRLYRMGDRELAASKLVSAFQKADTAISLRLVDATIETLKLRREVNLDIVERNKLALGIGDAYAAGSV